MRSFSSSLSSLPLFCSLCRSLTLCIVVPRLSLLKYRRLCLQRLCSADRHPRGVARRRERQRRRQRQHLAPRQFPFGLFDRALRAAAAAAAAGPVAGPAAPRQAQGHRARCRLEEPRRCRSLLLPLFFSLFFLWRRRRHLLSPSLWQLAPDHHRRARHPRLNSRLTIDCARSLPPPFLSSFSFSFLPENSSADLFCPWSSSISQKKTTPISAFNACSGRGKRLEQAEEGDAKGDVELAGGNIGFATPAAAGAPSSLPAPSSAKA